MTAADVHDDPVAVGGGKRERRYVRRDLVRLAVVGAYHGAGRDRQHLRAVAGLAGQLPDGPENSRRCMSNWTKSIANRSGATSLPFTGTMPPR